MRALALGIILPTIVVSCGPQAVPAPAIQGDAEPVALRDARPSGQAAEGATARPQDAGESAGSGVGHETAAESRAPVVPPDHPGSSPFTTIPLEAGCLGPMLDALAAWISNEPFTYPDATFAHLDVEPVLECLDPAATTFSRFTPDRIRTLSRASVEEQLVSRSGLAYELLSHAAFLAHRALNRRRAVGAVVSAEEDSGYDLIFGMMYALDFEAGRIIRIQYMVQDDHS